MNVGALCPTRTQPEFQKFDKTPELIADPVSQPSFHQIFFLSKSVLNDKLSVQLHVYLCLSPLLSSKNLSQILTLLNTNKKKIVCCQRQKELEREYCTLILAVRHSTKPKLLSI